MKPQILRGLRFLFSLVVAAALLVAPWVFPAPRGAGLLCGARPLCVPVGGGPPARRPRRFARWLMVGAGLAGAGYGLFASVRWAAGLAETWKGRGMPMWSSWRER